MPNPTMWPCPFCGARGRKWLEMAFQVYRMECSNCGAGGPTIRPGVDTDGNYNQREAIEAWNTR
jgi:Lar family restriction alleviation protein